MHLHRDHAAVAPGSFAVRAFRDRDCRRRVGDGLRRGRRFPGAGERRRRSDREVPGARRRCGAGESSFDVQSDTVSASLAKLGELATYKPGDVLVSGRAGGLLRRIPRHTDRGRPCHRRYRGRVTRGRVPAGPPPRDRRASLRRRWSTPPGPRPRVASSSSSRRCTSTTSGSRLATAARLRSSKGSFSFQPQLDFDLLRSRRQLDGHLEVVASGEAEGKLHLRYDIHKPPPGLQSGAFVRFDNAGVPLVESAPVLRGLLGRLRAGRRGRESAAARKLGTRRRRRRSSVRSRSAWRAPSRRRASSTRTVAGATVPEPRVLRQARMANRPS